MAPELFSIMSPDELTAAGPRLLEVILNMVSNGIVLFKTVRNEHEEIVDFEYVLVNEAAKTYTGKGPLGKSFLTSPGNEHLFYLLAEVVKKEIPKAITQSFPIAGATSWCYIKYVKFGDGVLASYTDITEKKLAEKETLESENFIKQIANSTPAIIYVTNLDNRKISYINERVTEVFGFTQAQVYEAGHAIFLDITEPADYLLRMDHFTALESDPGNGIRETEVRMKVNDGTYHWFRIRDKVFKRKKDGTAISVIGVATDIDIVKTEKEKKEHENIIEQIIQNTADIIYVIDPGEKNILYTNDVFLQIFDLKKEYVTKNGLKLFRHLLQPEDYRRKVEHIKACKQLKEKEVKEIELRMHTKTSGWRWFCLRTTSLKSLNGDTLQLSITGQDITQKKLAEQELMESELHFRSLIDHTPDLITRWNRNLKLVYANNAFITKTGWTNDYILGKNNLEMGIQENNAMVSMDKLNAVFEEGKEQEHFSSYSAPNGLFYFYSRIVPEFDAKGEVQFALAITRDITKLKLSEQKIKEDAHFIQQIADTTPDILFIMDLNTHLVIYTNREFAADLGYSRQEIAMMKNPILDIMHEDDLPAMKEHLKQMKTIPDNMVLEIEYRLKNAGGGVRWFMDRNSVFKRNSRGTPVEKIGIAQNITEKKLHEEQIITSLKILKQAEQLSGMGSWEYDTLTGGLKWSEGMYQLFNLSPDIEQRPGIYLDYTPEEERPRVNKIINNILNEFVSFEETITLLPFEQEKKIIRIKAMVIKDNAGRPLKVIGVDLDITQQVMANEEINKLNKTLIKKNQELETRDREIKTFNLVAANDYKETLQQLYTNLEYLISKDARNLSDAGKANVRRAQSAIQKMNLLTDDINAYFKLYDLDVEITETDPNEIIKNVHDAFKTKLAQYNATIEYTEMPKLPSHPLLLTQLLSNLVDNSLKFRKQIIAPVIRINYSQADEMNAIPAALKDRPYGIISVSDNGIGVNEGETEKIFELFYRLSDKGKNRGFGIGLAICKKIMAMHHGFITAESNPANGATFNCYFPLKS